MKWINWLQIDILANISIIHSIDRSMYEWKKGSKFSLYGKHAIYRKKTKQSDLEIKCDYDVKCVSQDLQPTIYEIVRNDWFDLARLYDWNHSQNDNYVLILFSLSIKWHSFSFFCQLNDDDGMIQWKQIGCHFSITFLSIL